MNYGHLPVATTVPVTVTCSVCFDIAADYLTCFSRQQPNHVCADCYDRHLDNELEEALANRRRTPALEQRPHNGLQLRCINAACEDQQRCALVHPQSVARFVRDPNLYERYLSVLRTLARREDATSVNLADVSQVVEVPRSARPWLNTAGCVFSGLEVRLPRLGPWKDARRSEEEEEETKEETKNETEATGQDDRSRRCSVLACSRKIHTWKWWEHHCRSCGRAVCASCASFSVYDSLDVESHGKRRPKRVCAECLETFLCRLGDGGDGNSGNTSNTPNSGNSGHEQHAPANGAAARAERHLLQWETKFLVPHAQRHVDKLHWEILARLKSREHRVRKMASKLTSLRRRLDTETRSAVRTSSSEQEDQAIRARLEDELEMARGCLASVLTQSIEDQERDVDSFQLSARSRPRSRRSRPESLVVRRSLHRDARVDASQVERWTLCTRSLVERWEMFCHQIEEQADLVVADARRTFDFSLLAQARREAEARVSQIRADEQMVRATFEGGRACPKCEWWVHRTEGCDHITCQCGHNFCYQCGMDSHRSTCCYPRSHAR